MDLNSLTPEDHARRYALLGCICLGCFAFLACWMAVGLHFLLSALVGVALSLVLFFPIRALMRAVLRR